MLVSFPVLHRRKATATEKWPSWGNLVPSPSFKQLLGVTIFPALGGQTTSPFRHLFSPTITLTTMQCLPRQGVGDGEGQWAALGF